MSPTWLYRKEWDAKKNKHHYYVCTVAAAFDKKHVLGQSNTKQFFLLEGIT